MKEPLIQRVEWTNLDTETWTLRMEKWVKQLMQDSKSFGDVIKYHLEFEISEMEDWLSKEGIGLHPIEMESTITIPWERPEDFEKSRDEIAGEWFQEPSEDTSDEELNHDDLGIDFIDSNLEFEALDNSV